MSLSANLGSDNKKLIYWYRNDDNSTGKALLTNTGVRLNDNLWHLVTIIIHETGGSQSGSPSNLAYLNVYIDTVEETEGFILESKPKYGLGTFTIGKGTRSSDYLKG